MARIKFLDVGRKLPELFGLEHSLDLHVASTYRSNEDKNLTYNQPIVEFGKQ